jgi:hypothetical protein
MKIADLEMQIRAVDQSALVIASPCNFRDHNPLRKSFNFQSPRVRMVRSTVARVVHGVAGVRPRRTPRNEDGYNLFWNLLAIFDNVTDTNGGEMAGLP